LSVALLATMPPKKRFSFINRVLDVRKGGLSSDEAMEFVAKLNEKINQQLPEGEGDRWFELFKEFDGDASGLLTFDELKFGIRTQLLMDESELSNQKLKALWITLDEDDSGFVESGEFGRFMKREAPKNKDEERRELLRQSSRQKRASLEKDKQLQIADAMLTSSVPTAEMRAELAQAGVALPNDEELAKMATQFSRWTKLYLPDAHQGSAWIKVIQMVGDDMSGLLTYDQVRRVVREVFKVKKVVWSENMIKALWCTLDVKNADSIPTMEFGRFVKRADTTTTRAPGWTQKQWTGNSDRLLEVRPGGLSAEECKSVAATINSRVDEMMPGEDWLSLFKAIDEDASGLLSFDEFKQGIRESLKMGTTELSDAQLGALWISIDEDDSGYVETGELYRFLNRIEPKGKDEQRRELIRQSSKRKRALLERAQTQDILDEKFKSSMKTTDMKAELKAKGVPLATEDTMREASFRFVKWTKTYLPDAHHGVAWMKVFKEVDNDASGLLTYDELRIVIRQKFKVPSSEFSEDDIKVLWCALDQDHSDSIKLVEFGRFIKLMNGKMTNFFQKTEDSAADRLFRGLSSLEKGAFFQKHLGKLEEYTGPSTLKLSPRVVTQRRRLPDHLIRPAFRPKTSMPNITELWTPKSARAATTPAPDAEGSVSARGPPRQVEPPPHPALVRSPGQRYVEEGGPWLPHLALPTMQRSLRNLASDEPLCSSYLPRHGLVPRAFGDNSYYVQPPVPSSIVAGPRLVECRPGRSPHPAGAGQPTHIYCILGKT
jgi:Ca2+-binding EF-hand superfamily protein